MANKAKAMVQVFEDAMAKPFTNLIIDLKTDTTDLVKFRSNVLLDESEPFGRVHLAHVYAL